MKIATICGSRKFKAEFLDTENKYKTLGYFVLGMEDMDLGIPHDIKEKLDSLHRRKIELADIVVFVIVDNYVGPSVLAEYSHALCLNKDIIIERI